MTAEPAYPETPPQIRIRLVEPDAIVRASADPELMLDRAFVASAIERGDLMFGAYDGDLLVSYLWRALGPAPHTDGLWVRVAKPCCYSYKSLTRPAYRGQRLSPATQLFSDAKMLAHDYTHRAGFIAISNYESLAMGRHMGSRTVGYAGYLNWFGRYFPFRSKGARNIGFEFYRVR